MNARTIMSAKGQVVIPKDVRDRLGLVPGEQLDVIEMGGGVLLKARPVFPKLSFEDAAARLREIIRYDGPALTIEEMDLADADMRALLADGNDLAGD